MDCKCCGVLLLEEEIPDRMCSKCPEYCDTCKNVLPWERLVCEHEDGTVHKLCYNCTPQHIKEYGHGYR